MNVAERCNLRCTYCYAGEGDYGSNSLMTFETARRAILFFAKPDSVLEIAFFGGEPLLNFALVKEVVEWCAVQNFHFRFSLTTNAVLLHESHLEFFKKHNFELKISYDGRELQDTQRTQNPQLAALVEKKLQRFEESLHALRSFQLRTTVSRKHIDSFARNILSTLNSHQYRIQYARVSSAASRERFLPEDADKLNALLTQMVEHLIEEKNWTHLLRIGNLKSLIRKIHFGRMQAFCGAGINYLSVSTSGAFYLCHRFTEDKEECVGDIHRGLDQAKLGEIAALRGRTKEPCRSCWMRNVCQGGCFHEHKMATGNIGTVDPVFCKLQDHEMTLALRVYIILRNQAPEALAEVLA